MSSLGIELVEVIARLPDGLVICDGDGTMLLVNPELARMLGYEQAELIGQSIDSLVPEAVKSSHGVLRARYAAAPTKRHMGVGLDLSARCKDGSDLPVEISLSPLDGEELRVIAVVRDTSATRAERERLQQHDQRSAVFADRQRIARELHDRVIGRLFAAGLGLQGMLSMVSDKAVQQQGERTIEEIDHSIADLRHAIFSLLHDDESTVPIHEVRRTVGRIARDRDGQHGLVVRFDAIGPDVSVGADVVDGLVSALTEAMVNVWRHANARKVLVTLRNDRDHITLTVTDDGNGPPAEAHADGAGLSNLADRAATLGGSCVLRSADADTPHQTGAVLEWSVPLR
jgi:PAS domain S-box-containing protein